MNSQRRFLDSASSPWLLRSLAIAVLGLTSAISVLASADGPTQPDPPVPLEGPVRMASVATNAADREPDCRCGVLHARDIESRVEGHVERWEALSRNAMQKPARTARHHRSDALHGTSFVEGVVGFPVRQFRLAADTPEDDGAGSD